MTIEEATDYIETIALGGISLTVSGRNAAIAILERRKDWTPAHSLMLSRLQDGAATVPLKLGRLVSDTRLGDAIALVRDLERKHIRNQKNKARRRAAKAKHMKWAA